MGNVCLSRKKQNGLGFKILEAGLGPFIGKAYAIKKVAIAKNIYEKRLFFDLVNQYVQEFPT